VEPVPLSVTACGLPDASSVIVTLADRAPVAVGENVALMVHVALGASVPGQSFVCAKSAAFAPVMTMPEIVSDAFPLLRSVAVCAPLVVPRSCGPNPRLGGLSVTAGAGAPPVPDTATECGLPLALSETRTLAARMPPALGVNVTLITHVAFTASDAGQSFVCAKSPAASPETVMPLIDSVAVPVLRSVDVCAVLVVPTSCVGNSIVDGVSVTAGAVPVPPSVTLCGLPDALSVTWTLAARAPVAVGANVAAMPQLAPAPSVDGASGHVVVVSKSDAFAPATAIAHARSDLESGCRRGSRDMEGD